MLVPMWGACNHNPDTLAHPGPFQGRNLNCRENIYPAWQDETIHRPQTDSQIHEERVSSLTQVLDGFCGGVNQCFWKSPHFMPACSSYMRPGWPWSKKKHLAIGELYTVSLDLKYFQMVWNPFYNPPSCEANLQHPEMTGVGPILEGQQLKQHVFPRFFHDRGNQRSDPLFCQQLGLEGPDELWVLSLNCGQFKQKIPG